MPKRTTPFQMVVHAVRRQLAATGATVTESKIFVDPATGTEREVDIVVEGKFDGDDVMTCLEVVEHGRRPSVTWVEQQIKKHQRLPTTTLILVSKRGFSKAALREVAAEGGWVRTAQPTSVLIDGTPAVKLLYMDTVTLSPTSYRVLAVDQDGSHASVERKDDIDIYDAAGDLIGSLGEFVCEVINLPWLVLWFQIEAHNHQERDALTGFSCAVMTAEAGYFIHDGETHEPYLLAGIEILGNFAYTQDEVSLAITELDGRRYAAEESGTFIGRPVVWVGTDDHEAKRSTLSWRTLDNKPLTPAVSTPTNRFTGLHKISTPPEITELIAKHQSKSVATAA